MKKFSLVTLFIGAIIFTACNSNSNSETKNSDSTSTSMSNNDTNKMAPAPSADTSKMVTVGDDAKDFSKDAAQGGMVALRTHSQTLSF